MVSGLVAVFFFLDGRELLVNHGMFPADMFLPVCVFLFVGGYKIAPGRIAVSSGCAAMLSK